MTVLVSTAWKLVAGALNKDRNMDHREAFSNYYQGLSTEDKLSYNNKLTVSNRKSFDLTSPVHTVRKLLYSNQTSLCLHALQETVFFLSAAP